VKPAQKSRTERLPGPRGAPVWCAALSLLLSICRGEEPFRPTRVFPAVESHIAESGAEIRVAFNSPISNQTVSLSSFVVWGMFTGARAGHFSFPSATQVVFRASVPFRPGEKVLVSITSNVCDRTGRASEPWVWQFRTAAAASSGTGHVACALGNPDKSATGAALGDVDGDGDLDAVAACRGSASEIWTQDGTGTNWTLHESIVISADVHDVVLGDFDNDGDLDAFWCCRGGQRVWFNNGGLFSDSGQALGEAEGAAAAVGDIDGDGDLDVAVACCGLGEPVQVWLNNGAGMFSDSGLRLGDHETLDLAFADVDRDGDLDLICAGLGSQVIWLNENGRFSAGWRAHEGLTGGGRAVATADFDGDGWADFLMLGYYRGSGSLWLNQGSGTNFVPTGPGIVGSALDVCDLDGDGVMDAFFSQSASNTLWRMPGAGNGAPAALRRPIQGYPSGTALGDLDGDGDIDAFLVNDRGPREIWLNQ